MKFNFFNSILFSSSKKKQKINPVMCSNDFIAIVGFCQCNRIMCWELEKNSMEAIRCGGN